MIRSYPDPIHCLAAGALVIALCGCSSTLGNFGLGGAKKSTQTASVDEALVGNPQASQQESGPEQANQQSSGETQASETQAGEAQAGETRAGEPEKDRQQTASVRPYSSPGYCPQIEIRDGTQALQKYIKPNEPSPGTIIWQAAIGETARECKVEANGIMTIRVGVSGKVLAGPKGGPADVTVPIRVAVVKFQEAVLASELYKEQVTIGANHSTVFRRIYEIEVPAPGRERNYILYVGFDDGKKKN